MAGQVAGIGVAQHPIAVAGEKHRRQRLPRRVRPQQGVAQRQRVAQPQTRQRGRQDQILQPQGLDRRVQTVAGDIADHKPQRLAGRGGPHEVAADHALGRMKQRPQHDPTRGLHVLGAQPRSHSAGKLRLLVDALALLLGEIGFGLDQPGEPAEAPDPGQ
jgi:hypothetical protein